MPILKEYLLGGVDFAENLLIYLNSQTTTKSLTNVIRNSVFVLECREFVRESFRILVSRSEPLSISDIIEGITISIASINFDIILLATMLKDC